MASESYPNALPGVLNNSNSYSLQALTVNNDLSSGPPVVRLVDDSAWVAFDVEWSYNAQQVQLFRNWFRWNLKNGSKLFDIELWVEGFDGTKNTLTHECYFIPGTYRARQNGKRWRISATLIAIDQQTLSEEAGCSLQPIYDGFEEVPETINLFYECIDLIEELWIP